ncbi:hypothetical protein [Enhygromyxa salina]|uniref:hypothetical protein n=1 Tax=Enhygromyxa salina TaxID=215803 RepID=UPI0011BA53B4|nr:hypothetical protein [Enhygromyxa salina]
MSKAGVTDATASLQGSAVTGKSFSTGKAFGPHSDFDVALASESLFLRAKKLGIEIGTNPARIGPLTPKQIKQMRLDKVHRTLERNAEREVNFMIFKSQERALQWSADTIRF